MLLIKVCFIICSFYATKVYSENNGFPLSVVHFNDFHSRYEETNLEAGPCKDKSKCIGGFSRLYKEINSLLNENPKSILLNAGDTFQGTLWYSIGRWNVTQQFFSKLPIDAETIGNHEFENGIEGLIPYIKSMKHPFVVSNIDDSLEPSFQGIYKKSTVIKRDGRKIGVIGVVTTEYPSLANTSNLKFLDESSSINAEAERLIKEEGVFTNIILSHCGYDIDKKLAANATEKISLIVGGHSHTFLWTGDNPPGPAKVEGPYPTIVESKHGHKVLITQASAFNRYLGNITIYLDDEGEILDYQGKPIYLDTDFLKDEDINEELLPWKEIVDETGEKIVGSSLVTLSSKECNVKECTLGNFATDAMVFAYTENTSKFAWTEAAIGFISPGGLKTDLDAGNITFNELFISQPYADTWNIGILTGQDIKDIFEYTVQDYTKDNPTNLNLLQVSGIRLVYDLEQAVGNRVVSVRVRCQNCTVPIYENLDLSKDYNAVVSGYLVKGGDGFTTFRDKMRNVKLGRTDIDILMDYLSKRSPVFEEIEERIVFKKN